MTELGVAIFGAGRAGHGHARAIAQTSGTRLTAVFDTDRQRADGFAEPTAAWHSPIPIPSCAGTTCSW
jgi:predicted dehydrogenase